MEFKSWYRQSACGEGEIYSCGYFIENPKAILQIAHGMCEHSGRYDEFARALAEAGYLVCANDHLGHGNSDLGHRGSFALSSGGFDYVIQDMDSLFEEVGSRYAGVPKMLLGHSMGSILAALFADKYDYLEKLILMGSPASNGLVGIAEKILQHNVKKYGYTHCSKLCNFLMWGPESFTLEEKRISKSWMSHDKENIERFITDEKCNFAFNDSANLELVRGLQAWMQPTWGNQIPNIPILVIAGSEDKIGNNGKGPTSYYNRLKVKHDDVTLKLIEHNRHEILNEATKHETFQYIIKWLD
ncbi:MAG: alpha/beta fold hydrolase [Eubacteriales bacterium]